MRKKQKIQREFFDVLIEENCTEIDQVLQEIFQILKKNPEILDLVHQDLCKGLKNPKTGKSGITAEQVVGFNLVKLREGTSYKKTRDRIADSISLRKLTGFHSSKVPGDKAFIKTTNRLSFETVAKINDLVVKAAEKLGEEKGKKIRADCTVVDANIHYPSDNTLMVDTVRVLTRKAKEFIECNPHLDFSFPNRLKATKRRSREIGQGCRGKGGKEKKKKLYAKLIQLTKEVIELSKALRTKAREEGYDIFSKPIFLELEHFEELGLKVIDQAERRIFHDEQVPSSEKIVSIFEEHTDIIVRGKKRKPVEFGHKILLVESASGLITYYLVCKGNPSEKGMVEGVLEEHKRIFGKYPDFLSTDRGFYSKTNIELCEQADLKDIIIPKPGYKDAYQREKENSSRFKKDRKWRNGIEGRISVLMRGYGMDRCLLKGEERFKLFIGLCVLAHNLYKLGQKIAAEKKKKRKKKAA